MTDQRLTDEEMDELVMKGQKTFDGHFEDDVRAGLARAVLQLRNERTSWKAKARNANREGYEAVSRENEVRRWFAMYENDPWRWQGDGEDHLESLVCPVLIHADTLRELLESER